MGFLGARKLLLAVLGVLIVAAIVIVSLLVLSGGGSPGAR